MTKRRQSGIRLHLILRLFIGIVLVAPTILVELYEQEHGRIPKPERAFIYFPAVALFFLGAFLIIKSLAKWIREGSRVAEMVSAILAVLAGVGLSVGAVSIAKGSWRVPPSGMDPLCFQAFSFSSSSSFLTY